LHWEGGNCRKVTVRGEREKSSRLWEMEGIG
jgi:hypothetical protein